MEMEIKNQISRIIFNIIKKINIDEVLKIRREVKNENFFEIF